MSSSASESIEWYWIAYALALAAIVGWKLVEPAPV